jgi:hypothetical protein
MKKFKEKLKENIIGYLIVFALSMVGSIIMYSVRTHDESVTDFEKRLELKVDMSYFNTRINEIREKQKEDKSDILRAVNIIDVKTEKQTDRIIEILKNKNK